MYEELARYVAYITISDDCPVEDMEFTSGPAAEKTELQPPPTKRDPAVHAHTPVESRMAPDTHVLTEMVT